MNEGWLSDFLEYKGWNQRDILLEICDIPQDKGKRIPKAIWRSSGLPPHFQKGLGNSLGFKRPEDLPPKTTGANGGVATSICISKDQTAYRGRRKAEDMAKKRPPQRFL